MALTKRGSFCFNQDAVTFVAITDNITARIGNVTKDVARVSFQDAQGADIPITTNIRMTQASNKPNPPLRNGFSFTWLGSYTLFVNNEPYIQLHREKQHEIRAPMNAASWVKE